MIGCFHMFQSVRSSPGNSWRTLRSASASSSSSLIQSRKSPEEETQTRFQLSFTSETKKRVSFILVINMLKIIIIVVAVNIVNKIQTVFRRHFGVKWFQTCGSGPH